jgi:ubiquinone/menaquinone biosynthesis C-methylase UbiE
MGLREIQTFFDTRAAAWDDGIERKFVERAGRLVSGLDIRPGHRVLDVGTGTGVLVPLLSAMSRPGGSVTAMDVSREMLREASRRDTARRASYLQGDATVPPFDAACFDWVVCYSVFPHFTDHAAALSGLCRLLRPGGFLAVCHSQGRASLNAMHREVGGTVARDRLPEDSVMAELFEGAGLGMVELRDTEEAYLALGMRPA